MNMKVRCYSLLDLMVTLKVDKHATEQHVPTYALQSVNSHFQAYADE